MKIDMLARDGSPLGVTMKSLWGKDNRIGVGGSEYGMLTLCEGWANAGHTVRLYNDPYEANASNFEQLPTSTFNPRDERDILITFRSPNPRSLVANGKKVWLSCDQFTIDDFAKFAPYMDQIVCISPFHVEYFKKTYNIQNAICIDLPVRTHDLFYGSGRVNHQVLFSSVPERGLMNLWRIWPKIVAEVPDAQVKITSDYRLWGCDEGNIMHRVKWGSRSNFEFLGAVTRDRLVQLEVQSDILLYPSNYDELLCIAVAEAECAGAYPITSATGALLTTNMGTIIPVDANDPNNDGLFVESAVEFMLSADKEIHRLELIEKSCDRFRVQNVLDQWNKQVFDK